MAHLEQHLGDGRDAGGGLAVPDVRLDRADRAEPVVRPLGSAVEGRGEGLLQSLDLDRVAEHGSGAVGLDIGDGRRIQTGLPQGTQDDVRLRARVGHRIAIGLAAMVQRAGPDDGLDATAFRPCARQGHQQHGADALGGHITVAALAEGPTTPVARAETALAQDQILLRMNRGVHPARHGQLAFAPSQALAGQMDGRQGRRAHAVQRQARTMPVEEVRHPIGDGREVGTERNRVALETLLDTVELIVAVHGADEDTDLTIVEARLGAAGILQGMPDGLQEQALLGVHVAGLERGDVEEHRVEPIHVPDEAAPFVARLARRHPSRIIVVLDGPAFAGHFLDTVPPGREVGPEFIQIGGHRVATGHPDDRDRVVGDGRRRGPWNRRDIGRIDRHGRLDRARGADRLRGGRDLSVPRVRPAERPGESGGMLVEQIGAERLQGRVFEQDRSGEIAEVMLQHLREGRDHDRVETIVLDRLIGQHVGDLELGQLGEPLNQVVDHLFACRFPASGFRLPAFSQRAGGWRLAAGGWPLEAGC